MRKTYILILAILFISSIRAQSDKILQSGPMVGYTEMREALLWVQTQQEAEVYFSYSTKTSPETVFRTTSVRTEKSSAFTAKCVADQVQPGNTYQYSLFINGAKVDLPYPTEFQTPPLWQYRTDPPEMTIALGSCVFVNDSIYDRPGNPYGGGYDIFTALYEAKPDLMLWLGDNIYLREADWYSRTGINYRYTHTRSLPEMQPLLANTSNYAIWDDHDYGPNNSDKSYGRKEEAEEIFKNFWGNPTYGLDELGGITTTFEWGDAQFFLMDNRYHRSPNDKQTATRTILGKTQLNWLIDALISSSATFKFVCIGGQILNDVSEFENYANIAPEERIELLQTIVKEEIQNVIFLSGDRHHSELSKYVKDEIIIYDFTSSPLTSGAHDASDEPNSLRVEGSHVGERNYGLIQIQGARTSRSLTLSLHDIEGKELFSHRIEAQ